MSPDEQIALANGLMKNHIKPALGENQGAALFVFTYGEGGLTSYIGTANRESTMKVLKEMVAKWEEEDRQQKARESGSAIQMLPDELPKEMFDPTDGGKDTDTATQMVAIKVHELIVRHGTAHRALYHVISKLNPDMHHLKVMAVVSKVSERSSGDDQLALATAVIYATSRQVEI